MSLTTDEIVEMCDKLSYKYKSQRREDLVQEGVLAIYEILAEEPDAHAGKLYKEADRAMWDHLNFASLPVSMPITPASRGMMRGAESYSGQTYSEEGEEALREGVSSVSVEYDDAEISVPDYAETYEKMEYEAYVASKVVTVLDGVDLDIIKLRYYHDMTQEEVGKELHMSKQAVSRREAAALEKLKRKL